MILINKTIEYLDNYFKKNYRLVKLFNNKYLNTTSFINTKNIRLLGPYLYLKYTRIQNTNIIIENSRLYMIKYKSNRYFNCMSIILNNSNYDIN